MASLATHKQIPKPSFPAGSQPPPQLPHVVGGTPLWEQRHSHTHTPRSHTHSHSCRGPYFTLVQTLLIHTDTKLTLPLTRTHTHFP